jgi:hypothetical protein
MAISRLALYDVTAAVVQERHAAKVAPAQEKDDQWAGRVSGETNQLASLG